MTQPSPLHPLQHIYVFDFECRQIDEGRHKVEYWGMKPLDDGGVYHDGEDVGSFLDTCVVLAQELQLVQPAKKRGKKQPTGIPSLFI